MVRTTYLCTIAKQSEDLCCPGATAAGDEDHDDEDPETPPFDDDGAFWLRFESRGAAIGVV